MTTIMMRTFASFSFGCRVNQAEKEMLDRQLLTTGFQYSEKNPSLYIINTCAVTQKAEREARQLIYQTRRKWPKAKIIVTGCAATKWTTEGIKIDGIDIIIDNTNKEYTAEIINQRLNQSSKNIDKSVSGRIDNNLYLLDKYQNSSRLLVKIQDGCQRFCTFCIVPYLRGTPKSIKINEIIKTINTFAGDASDGFTLNGLTMKGFPDVALLPLSPTKWSDFETKSGTRERQDPQIQEVILTAINTQAYGFDTGESFITLMNRIIEVTRMPRISLGSIHPWSINGEFFKFYQSTLSHNRLVKFFHIPLQSGSNKILQLMKRGYTREEFIEKLKTLEKIHPLTFIGTDIIVGFLEETDIDFEDTYNFLKDSPISKFHVFRFSKREKTAAFYMAKRLHEPTPAQKAKRAKALIELGSKKYQQFLQKHIGKTFPALFLERKKDGYQEALLDNQIPTFIKTNKNLTGEIRQVKIEGIKEGKLLGEIDRSI